MYPTPSPTAVLPATVGTLAITGINSLALGLVGSALIVFGVLVLRIAYLASSRTSLRAAA